MTDIFETFEIASGEWKRLVMAVDDSGDAQLFLFAAAYTGLPDKDYWFETAELAKTCSLDVWGAPLESWRPATTGVEFLTSEP